MTKNNVRLHLHIMRSNIIALHWFEGASTYMQRYSRQRVTFECNTIIINIARNVSIDKQTEANDRTVLSIYILMGGTVMPKVGAHNGASFFPSINVSRSRHA